jgi:hypothetical protein
MFVRNVIGASLPQRTRAAAASSIISNSFGGLLVDDAPHQIAFKAAPRVARPIPMLGQDFHRSEFFDRAARRPTAARANLACAMPVHDGADHAWAAGPPVSGRNLRKK